MGAVYGRASFISHLAIPVWQQTLGLPAAIWWSHLNRLVAAFEDLDCASLLERETRPGWGVARGTIP